MLFQYFGISLAKILDGCTAIVLPSRGPMTLKEFADDRDGLFRDEPEKATLLRDAAEVRSFFSQAAFMLRYVNDQYNNYPNYIRNLYISFDYPDIYSGVVMSILTETSNIAQKGHIIVFVAIDLINGDGPKRIKSEATLKRVLEKFYDVLCKKFPFDRNDKVRFVNFSSNLIFMICEKMKDLSGNLENVHGLSEKYRKIIGKNAKKWKKTSKGKTFKTTAYKGICTPTGPVSRDMFKRKFKRIGRRASSRYLGKSKMHAHTRKYYESPSVDNISSLEPSFTSKEVSDSSGHRRYRRRRPRSSRDFSYSGGICHSFSTMIADFNDGFTRATGPIPVKMAPIKDFYNRRDPNLKPPSHF